jgi:hypothetical protein
MTVTQSEVTISGGGNHVTSGPREVLFGRRRGYKRGWGRNCSYTVSDRGFPCFYSAATQTPGYNGKRGTNRVPQTWRPWTKVIPPKSQSPSAKAIPPLWVQLPDIHPTKVLFAKDKLPERFTFPPVATAASLNVSRPSARQQTRQCNHIPSY